MNKYQILIFIIIISELNSYDNIQNIIKTFKKDNNKKNLIIGAIFKYSWKQLRNFFVSLIKAEFDNCDFVIFVGNVDNETKEKIKSFGVTVYDIPDKYPLSKYKIHSLRFKLYEEYILKNIDKYNMIFTADTRDVIFQKDIFKFYENYPNSFLGIFYEEGKIINDWLNKKWINFYCPV